MQFRQILKNVLGGYALRVLDNGDGSGTVVVSRQPQVSQYATGTIAASGDQTIIGAPAAGTQICITQLRIQNESSTATTVIIKLGATNGQQIGRVLCQNQGDGIDNIYPVEDAIRVGTGLAFVLNLSGNNSIGYSIKYFLEATT